MNCFRRLFSRRRINSDLSAEIEEHLNARIDELVASGSSRAEATCTARCEFGNVALLTERGREVWQFPSIESFLADVRFALRILRKSPGFTVIAVLTVALGIGASTAVFSLVDAVLLKPPPFPHAERIVFPWRLPRNGLNLGVDRYPWGNRDFLFFLRESKTFADLGAFQSDSFNLTGSGEPVRLNGLRASAGFFPSLGVLPSLGRTFTDEEDRPGKEREVILSDGLWQERFGADPDILGRVVELNNISYTVIGVMPRGFVFPRANEMPDSFTFAPQVQLWIPLALDREALVGGEDALAVVGRLKPGVTVARAQAEMDLLGKRLESGRTNGKGWFHSDVTPLERQVAGDTRQPLLLILTAMGVLMLIACSNIGSLLLTRSLNRKRELAVRSALGCGSSRLIRQLLTESIVLAGIGGVMGTLVAKAAINVAKILGPSSIPRLDEAGLDLRVLLFALGATLLTGILFGLAPAAGAARENLVESLKDGGRRASSNPAVQKARNSLLISQIALALVLVIATGLLTRTFYRLLGVDPGFHATHVLTFELSLPVSRYPDQSNIVALYQEVLRRLRSLPGVQAAGLTETVPLNGVTEATAIRTPDRPLKAGSDIPMTNYTMVSPDYFSAVGTPILRGRAFLESDMADSMPVTIINSAMANRFWPNQDALGKQVGPAGSRYPLATIVGIAADVKHLSLREVPSAEMYVPYTQKVWPSLLTMNAVLRTAQDPASLAASARDTIHSVDADLPLANVKTLDDIVVASLAGQRFAVFLLEAFSGLALLLATIGMYGVISYNVTQRTQEIGIRMALGARRGNVFHMVIGQGARLAALGIMIGLAASLGITRLISNFLFGVRATDPSTFVGVSLLLLGIGLLACYIPARRAMQVDPTVALRHE